MSAGKTKYNMLADREEGLLLEGPEACQLDDTVNPYSFQSGHMPSSYHRYIKVKDKWLDSAVNVVVSNYAQHPFCSIIDLDIYMNKFKEKNSCGKRIHEFHDVLYRLYVVNIQGY